MSHGGKRDGAGRKVGSTTTRTREIAEAIMADGELTPLEFLTSIYRDPRADEAKRIDAAKAAAPYVHAKLATTTLQGPEGGPLQVAAVDAEWRIIDPSAPDSTPASTAP
jgi:hypothetical protein